MDSTQIKIITGLILFLIIIGLIVIIITNKKIVANSSKKQIIKKMTMLGILSALSLVLYLLEFPLPIFVPFLKIQFSNIPVLLASFIFGPYEAIIIAILRTLIKIPFSQTFCVGELQDLIISAVISIIASLIYKKNKTKRSAIFALCVVILVWTSIALISNTFVSIPLYTKIFFNGDVEGLVNIIGSVIPNVDSVNYIYKYLLLSCLPFNALLSILVSLITFFVYKRVSILFKSYINN